MLIRSLAKQLQLLVGGEQIPASRLKHTAIADMVAEGVVSVRLQGRTKKIYYIEDKVAFANYVYNRWAIEDLATYIEVIENPDTIRAELVQVSTDSKASMRRTFKGFLVNSYVPIDCTLNGNPIVIKPHAGTFQFIHDFENFVPATDAVIIGVENAENFRLIERQQYLFPGIRPLIVSRYPQRQSKDLLAWLLSIPNRYWHFGDYDLAGIHIYLNEYKKHLGARASFFVPADIEELIAKYGNRNLYDAQRQGAKIDEDEINEVVTLIHKYKKGLEQEVLIRGRGE